MDANRRFSELAGICKTCDDKVCTLDPDCCTDYTDPREVLRVMSKREDFSRWVAQINALSIDEDGDLIDNAIPVDLILDTTGKLRDLAIKWMEGRK